MTCFNLNDILCHVLLCFIVAVSALGMTIMTTTSAETEATSTTTWPLSLKWEQVCAFNYTRMEVITCYYCITNFELYCTLTISMLPVLFWLYLLSFSIVIFFLIFVFFPQGLERPVQDPVWGHKCRPLWLSRTMPSLQVPLLRVVKCPLSSLVRADAVYSTI